MRCRGWAPIRAGIWLVAAEQQCCGSKGRGARRDSRKLPAHDGRAPLSKVASPQLGQGCVTSWRTALERLPTDSLFIQTAHSVEGGLEGGTAQVPSSGQGGTKVSEGNIKRAAESWEAEVATCIPACDGLAAQPAMAWLPSLPGCTLTCCIQLPAASNLPRPSVPATVGPLGPLNG